MKNKLLLIIAVLSFFILFPTVSAESNNLKLKLQKADMNLDEVYPIDIINNTDENIISGSFLLTTDSDLVKFERLEFSENLDVELDGSQVNFTIKNNSKAIEKNQKIGTIFLKATKEAKKDSKVTINLSKISINTDKKTLKLSNVSTSFQLTSLSSNTNLKSLHSKFVRIDFSNEKTVYKVDVSFDVDEFDLVAEAEDKNAKVEISNQKLQNSITTIYITVIAENGHKKQYKVIVTKQVLIDNTETKIDRQDTKKSWIYIIVLSLSIILIDIGYIYYKNR